MIVGFRDANPIWDLLAFLMPLHVLVFLKKKKKKSLACKLKGNSYLFVFLFWYTWKKWDCQEYNDIYIADPNN